MTKPNDDGSNLTTMKALVFHGKKPCAGRQAKADDHAGHGRYRAHHHDHHLRD